MPYPQPEVRPDAPQVLDAQTSAGGRIHVVVKEPHLRERIWTVRVYGPSGQELQVPLLVKAGDAGHVGPSPTPPTTEFWLGEPLAPGRYRITLRAKDIDEQSFDCKVDVGQIVKLEALLR